RLAYAENHRGFRKEGRCDALRAVVVAEIEREAVRAGIERPRVDENHASALVARAAADRPPVVGAANFQDDGHADGGNAVRDIEHVRRDHVSSFARRIRVICRCSSAAACSSRAGSFASLRSRIRSMSAALFPVAQTMKMYPKRASYARFK